MLSFQNWTAFYVIANTQNKTDQVQVEKKAVPS